MRTPSIPHADVGFGAGVLLLLIPSLGFGYPHTAGRRAMLVGYAHPAHGPLS
jgi:hypothetical protein